MFNCCGFIVLNLSIPTVTNIRKNISITCAVLEIKATLSFLGSVVLFGHGYASLLCEINFCLSI